MEKVLGKRNTDTAIKCVQCGHEISLNHEVFKNYTGPVKCFACSAMMEVGMERGLVHSVKSLNR